jgi:hypothetical protein
VRPLFSQQQTSLGSVRQVRWAKTAFQSWVGASPYLDHAVRNIPKRGAVVRYPQAPTLFLGVFTIFHIVEIGGELFPHLAKKRI